MDIFVHIIKNLTGIMEHYGQAVFRHLSVGCKTTFSALFALWLVWEVVWNGVVQGNINFKKLITPFFTGVLIIFMLTLSHFMDWLYRPIVGSCSELVQEVIRAVAKDVTLKEPTIYGAIYALHDAFGSLFVTIDAMMKDSSWMFSINQFGSIIMRIPFMMLFGVVICYAINFMFKVMVFTAIAPLLIIYAGFPSTRTMALQGLKMIVHGTLTLTFSVLAMGLSLYLLKQTVTGIGEGDMGAFAFSESYWVCFMTACLSLYMQMQAPIVAGIVGVHEGPGAATFVAGMMTAGVTVAKAYAVKGIKAAGGYMGSNLKSGSQRMGHKIQSLFRDRGSSGNVSLDKIRGDNNL